MSNREEGGEWGKENLRRRHFLSSAASGLSQASNLVSSINLSDENKLQTVNPVHQVNCQDIPLFMTKAGKRSVSSMI